MLRRWTLRQQLTILTLLFLGLGSAALWLVVQFFQNLEGAIVAHNQRELASANTRLIQLFTQSPLPQSRTAQNRLDRSLQDLSTEALSPFARVEGGFYLLQQDQLIGYSFPSHAGPPKKDVPPAERAVILQLARRATSQGLPQELVMRPKLDVLVLRADPLPLWGAVWTMKRMPRTQDSRPKILSVVVGVGILSVGLWTFAISLQLQWSVQRLQHSIKAMESHEIEKIPPLPAEMGLLGSAINAMQSRRQELEQRLHRVERLAALGQLVAGVAHEVRNPLASMRLNLQYVDRQLQKQGNTALPIASLLEQVDRLDQLVKRLLYFDQNQASEVPSLTSPSLLVEESVALLRLQAEEKSVQLVYLPPETEIKPVLLRRRELGQVMVNLILNAIQASPAAGTVTIGVESHQELLKFWIEDQGAGLTDADLARIFEPFYSTNPQGSGLGLAISYEIASRNQGEIEVQSQPGRTRFSVILPIIQTVETST